jgi:16S rRNA processing protein RimM
MGRPSSSPPDGWLEIGHIRRPHGLKGDAFVQLVTDRTERLAPGAELWARDTMLVVERSRQAGNGRWIAGFGSLSDRTSVEAYCNEPLYAAPQTDAEALWVHELIGRSVIDQHGVDRGVCVAVLENPASDLLELTSGALVPTNFVTEAADVITVDVPDGLFDDSP